MREEIAWLCAFFDAFKRRDDGWLLRHTPEGFRYVASSRFPEGETVYTGAEGVFELWRFMDEAFGELELGTPSITDLGDVVLVESPVRARPPTSGIPLEGRPAQLWTFENGVAARADSYVDSADAMEALRERKPGAG